MPPSGSWTGEEKTKRKTDKQQAANVSETEGRRAIGSRLDRATLRCASPGVSRHSQRRKAAQPPRILPVPAVSLPLVPLPHCLLPLTSTSAGCCL